MRAVATPEADAPTRDERSPRDAPEEVAVCEVCGLVSRTPGPPVCPACGAGRG